MRGVNFVLSRVFLFDIDGTLTPHRQPIDPEFLEFFLDWAPKNRFYLTTGSDIDKVKEQLPPEVLNFSAGIFCCMGNQLIEDGKVVYSNEFTPSDGLLEDLQSFLDHSDFPHPWREEPHIERRPGMINFSIPGRGIDSDLRRTYTIMDSRWRERLTIAEVLMNKYPELDVSIGGKISLDIYPKGNDKSQSVDYIMSHSCPSYIVFIGDRVFPGGNDYAAALAMERYNRGVWFNVSNWKETRAILRSSSLYINRDGFKTK